MTSLLESQLGRLEELAAQKADELDGIAYDRYFPVYEVAIHFFAKKPVLLYGGMAINDLLPAKLRFYPPKQLPDLDVFAKDGQAMAEALVKAYRRKGYPSADTKPALHPGTWKVFVEGLQVADVTTLSPAAFRRLREGSIVGTLGIRLANPRFLCMTLHQMLSQPMDAHRWTKAYQRLVAFYHTYPPEKCYPKLEAADASATHAASTAAMQAVMAWLKGRPYVLFGAHAFVLMAKKAEKVAKQFGAPYYLPAHGTAIDLLVEEGQLEEAARSLVEHLRKMKGGDLGIGTVAVSKVHAADDFVPAHVFIRVGGRSFVGLYETQSCMGYSEHNGLRIAGIHTMIRMFLARSFSSHRHHHLEDSECIAHLLGWILLAHVPSRKRLLQPFLLSCYGQQPGLITMRREFHARSKKPSGK